MNAKESWKSDGRGVVSGDEKKQTKKNNDKNGRHVRTRLIVKVKF